MIDRALHVPRVVVVGGGAAGFAAVNELGGGGFDGEIVVLAGEQHLPYDRTACSKGLLTGATLTRDVFLPMDLMSNVDWRLGTAAAALDVANQTIVTSEESYLEFDGLVLAPGSHPTPPPGWPVGAPGAHTMHGLADVAPFLADVRDAARVAILGGGLTGCELAYAVRALGRECVLIDRNNQVLTRSTGARIGWLVSEQMHQDGIVLRLGRRLRSVVRGVRRWEIDLDDGELIEADVVVAVTGERPATEWLRSSGLDVEDGIRCDAALRVVGAVGVVAAGSAARWPNGNGGLERFPHWLSALEQGRAAAQSLLATGWRVPAVRLVRRYWTELGELRIEVCGERPAEAREELVLANPNRGASLRSGLSLRSTVEGRLVGVVAVNAPNVFTAAVAEILTAPGRVAERSMLNADISRTVPR